jgi:hypothetical protein
MGQSRSLVFVEKKKLWNVSQFFLSYIYKPYRPVIFDQKYFWSEYHGRKSYTKNVLLGVLSKYLPGFGVALCRDFLI